MAKKTSSKKKSGEKKTNEVLIQTLKEIFQFDKNDLDFGIYRILNIKKTEIRNFIEKDLFDIISKEIETVDNSEMLLEQLEVLKDEIEKTFGCDIDDALTKNATAPKIQEYEKLALQIRQNENQLESQEEIFDHLINFFSRYYDSGDFISKRRYSKENKYAIPYNGEEVYLYWANHDQYYIKTAENFTHYSFKAGDWTVHFEITGDDVDIEKANIKDAEKKYFIFYDLKTTARKTLTIYFGYRGLTGDEEKAVKETVGKKSIRIDYVNAYNLKRIKEKMVISPIKELHEKHRKLDGELSDATELEWHLSKYTAKNTADYFIHKDLKGFLSHELDFYIKNEILDIDNITGESELTLSFKKIKAFKAISTQIIEFLTQIEEFQKKLWEKKKFVLSTDYLITLDHIDEKFYPEILKNTAQIDEWKRLNLIDTGENGSKKPQKTLEEIFQKKEGANGNDLLKKNPTLMIDTRFFDIDFKYKILSHFERLDEHITGILINSDNFHALKILFKKYQQKIKCCYIDPPYNTVHSKILYKNTFEHSSWLSLLNNTVPFSKDFLTNKSSFGFAIDDYELPNAILYLDSVFFNFDLSVIVVNHHPQGSGGKLSRTHEYYIICSTKEFEQILGQKKETYQEDRPFMRSGTAENNYRVGRWKSFYALLFDPKSQRIVDAEDPIPLGMPYPTGDINGLKRIYPINSRKEERVWRNSYETGKNSARNGALFVNPSSGTVYISLTHEDKRDVLFSNWTDAKFNAGMHGSQLLGHLGLGNEFDYPKSIHTIELGLIAQTEAEKNAIILDFFAGSGTTAHATLNLNKEDGGNRKFILVEMGNHFYSAIIPRIIKVVYSNNWQDGKPRDNEGSSSQIIKYHSLEQYEDSLQNIDFKIPGALAIESKDYQIKYMLDFESKDNPVFLDIDMLDDPFDYRLKIETENGIKTKKVDLIETFNYIAGIFVDSISKKEHGEIDYVIVKGHREEKNIIVIWRNKPDSFSPEEDKKFIESEILKDEEFDEILVNGNSLIRNAISLDEIFKKGMIGWD